MRLQCQLASLGPDAAGIVCELSAPRNNEILWIRKPASQRAKARSWLLCRTTGLALLARSEPLRTTAAQHNGDKCSLRKVVSDKSVSAVAAFSPEPLAALPLALRPAPCAALEWGVVQNGRALRQCGHRNAGGLCP